MQFLGSKERQSNPIDNSDSAHLSYINSSASMPSLSHSLSSSSLEKQVINFNISAMEKSNNINTSKMEKSNNTNKLKNKTQSFYTRKWFKAFLFIIAFGGFLYSCFDNSSFISFAETFLKRSCVSQDTESLDSVPDHLVNSFDFSSTSDSDSQVCHQSLPLKPPTADYSLFTTPEFRNWTLKNIQAAVKVPTESFDDLKPVGSDPRWDVFWKFEETLKQLFPILHKHLTLEHVNTHGLVYTWKGTDESLKPTLLMAHQDVVPVLPESRNLWTHDPYSAYFDGENVWGRGGTDMKGHLLAIMESIETLIVHHSSSKNDVFKPRRTIILAFGFDEEISGNYGAAHISKFLQDRYGPDGIHSIIDEGGMGIFKFKGVRLALPGVGEKGMYDPQIVLHTPGGHSSIPPDHSAIGIMGALAVRLESQETRFKPTLSTRNPVFGFLQCVAANSKELEDSYRDAILQAGTSKSANQRVVHALSATRNTKYMIVTSQALDIVNGGLKVNALPEKVTLTGNYRIAVEETVNSTRNKVIRDVLHVAKEYGVGVYVNDTAVVKNMAEKSQIEEFGYRKEGEEDLKELVPKTANGYFVVSDYGTFIEPAPITPAAGEAWETFAGSVRHVFENYAGPIVDPTSKVPLNDPSLLSSFGPLNTGPERILAKQKYRVAQEQALMLSSQSASSHENGNTEETQQKKNTVVVAPSLMLANTDTKHYWPLTKNIFRFSPTRLLDSTINNIHTVDEYVCLDVHIEGVKFFYTYILNL